MRKQPRSKLILQLLHDAGGCTTKEHLAIALTSALGYGACLRCREATLEAHEKSGRSSGTKRNNYTTQQQAVRGARHLLSRSLASMRACGYVEFTKDEVTLTEAGKAKLC